MAVVYASCNETVLNLPGLKVGVGDCAMELGAKAEGILTAVRASTGWDRIDEPSGQHFIDVNEASDPQHPADWQVELHAPNPIAVEFGHEPSGYYAGTDTRSPEGLFILYTAAGYSGRKRGRKRR
jgi:hypothetical protein